MIVLKLGCKCTLFGLKSVHLHNKIALPVKTGKRINIISMSSILTIETSTSVCSVALFSKGELVSERISFTGPSHASLLGVFIQEILQEAKQLSIRPDAVAVSCGPGSYTGLRIGVSMTKGLCYGWNVPLISVNTLKLLAATVIAQENVCGNTLLCPMLDARRMEVFSTFYTNQLEQTRTIAADIIDENSYNDILDQHQVLFFGNGAEKCRTFITHPNAVFIDNVVPKAIHMMPLAEQSFVEGKFEDVAYFEPFYLKEFVATVPKKKVIG
jgi:tRNA threonylcarbamoyladenosine biosynthesis protein TsaB